MIKNNLDRPYKIWARVTRGLEWIAAAEVLLLANITEVKTTHRNLFFSCPNLEVMKSLKCVDDFYLIWGEINGIDHTRAAFESIISGLNQLSDLNLTIKSLKKLRVTASILGKHNYSRYEIEDKIGQVLSKRLNLTYVDSKDEDTQDALWCRVHIAENKLLIGYRIHQEPLHRRAWRTKGLAGAIHPPVAAAMVLLADLKSEQSVIDPFCGSGTILIEAGLQISQLKLHGYDISEQSINNAHYHAKQAQVELSLTCLDSSSCKLSRADRIITNPPWGCTVDASGELTDGNMVHTIFRNLNHYGRAVLLTDAEMALPQRLKEKDLEPLFVETIRMAGRLTHLIVIGPAPLFPNDIRGKALASAWQKYRIKA